jgi:hypothetical protein
MAVTLTKVTVDGDLLTVEGTDSEGNPVIAAGWQSAMSNYYPPTSYDGDGNLVDGATARAMTAKEQKAYWQSLLDAATPTGSSPVVLFGG